jgi:hypothetical protein
MPIGSILDLGLVCYANMTEDPCLYVFMVKSWTATLTQIVNMLVSVLLSIMLL